MAINREALVANLIEADALLILTDQKGLYTADPRHHADAELVHLGEAGDPEGIAAADLPKQAAAMVPMPLTASDGPVA